jgi:hypothetical protein
LLCATQRDDRRRPAEASGRAARHDRPAIVGGGWIELDDVTVARILPDVRLSNRNRLEEAFDVVHGEAIEALKLQRPLPDGMLDIMARGESENGASYRQRKVPCVAAILVRGNVPA